MRTAVVLVALAFAGCADTFYNAPPDHYIASVYREDGRLMASRCELDPYGHATQQCETVAVDDEPSSPMPDAPDLPAPRRAPRPAPDAAALARAITASGAGRLIAQCRAVHADEAGAIDADVAIAPSGAITRLALRGATGAFADCAAAALRTTTIAPFDGDPVRVTIAIPP